MIKKVIIFSNSDGTIHNFRKDLISKLSQEYDVYVYCGSSVEGSYQDRLIKLGVKECNIYNFFQMILFIFRSSFSKRFLKSKVIGYTHLGNIYAFLFSLLTKSKCALYVTG